MSVNYDVYIGTVIKVIKKDDNNNFLDITQIALDNNFYVDLLYRPESSRDTYIPNNKNSGIIIDYKIPNLFQLNEDFFQQEEKRFAENQELQDFIQFIIKTYGDDSILIQNRSLFTFYS
jgi:hypothetical protein